MAKIGTAHIELKPVLDHEALAAIVEQITEAVRAGVAAGMRDANPPDELLKGTVTYNGTPSELARRMKMRRRGEAQ